MMLVITMTQERLSRRRIFPFSSRVAQIPCKKSLVHKSLTRNQLYAQCVKRRMVFTPTYSLIQNCGSTSSFYAPCFSRAKTADMFILLPSKSSLDQSPTSMTAGLTTDVSYYWQMHDPESPPTRAPSIFALLVQRRGEGTDPDWPRSDMRCARSSRLQTGALLRSCHGSRHVVKRLDCDALRCCYGEFTITVWDLHHVLLRHVDFYFFACVRLIMAI